MAGRRVLLRLDDASIIGPASSLGGQGEGVVRATAEQVAGLGRINQNDVDRLQRILDRLRGQGVRVPEPAPVCACLNSCLGHLHHGPCIMEADFQPVACSTGAPTSSSSFKTSTTG
jgi:hypothetical protein